MMQCRRNIVLHPVSLVVGREAKIYVIYPPDKLSWTISFWKILFFYINQGLGDSIKSRGSHDQASLDRVPTFDRVTQTLVYEKKKNFPK